GLEWNPRVNADDVTAGGGEVFEERRRAGSEVNEWHAGFLGERQCLAAVRLHVGAIVVGRQAADPTVEQLQRLRARARLRGEVVADEGSELAQEQVPGAWCLVHELLGLGERATGAPFDRVAREGKRRPGEADERHVR